jgi:hypothetical protein
VRISRIENLSGRVEEEEMEELKNCKEPNLRSDHIKK